MSEIPLNKFEKRDLVLRLLKEGKTYREICSIAHVSPRDIKPIEKEYYRKKRLQTKKGKENNQNGQIKKPSISSQAYKLFRDGKKLTDVAIDLEIPAKRALRLWSQFLRLEKMYECYEFYQVFQYELPQLLTISSFIKRNNIEIEKITALLKNVKNILNLQSYHYNLKNEIEQLKQLHIDYSLRILPPLQPLPRYITNYSNYNR